MNSQTIPSLLSEEQINIIAIGNVLFETTRAFSQKVNDELLSPIADWLNDPDFLEKHKVRIDEEIPDWASYKQRERNYNILFALEALRLKREQEKLRKDYLRAIASLIPRSRGEPRAEPATSATDYITPIATLLSPKAKERIDLCLEFDHAAHLSITLKYPWTTILSAEITESTTFTDLPIICPESPRSDITAKLQTLLQMETDGHICLSQTEPFGEISISPLEMEPDGEVIIKNKDGIENKILWNTLSDDERTDIIANIKENKIMCMGA